MRCKKPQPASRVWDRNAWHVAFQTDFGLCHFMRFQSRIHIDDDVIEKLSLLQPIEHFDKLRFVRIFFYFVLFIFLAFAV